MAEEKSYFTVSFPSIPYFFSEDPAWLKANGMAPLPEIGYLLSSKPLRRQLRHINPVKSASSQVDGTPTGSEGLKPSS